jgi:predicted small lipoprotein YifL
MKAVFISVFFLAMAGHLSGCGQKGPLYGDAPTKVDAVKEPGAEQAGSESEEHRSR